MPDETKTVVTERAEMVTSKQTNSVVVVLMRPVMIVLVRALRVYVQSLTGLLTATGTGIATSVSASIGVTMIFPDFYHALLASALTATIPAIMSILMNTGELLAKWDASHPMLRA